MTHSHRVVLQMVIILTSSDMWHEGYRKYLQYLLKNTNIAYMTEKNKSVKWDSGKKKIRWFDSAFRYGQPRTEKLLSTLTFQSLNNNFLASQCSHSARITCFLHLLSPPAFSTLSLHSGACALITLSYFTLIYTLIENIFGYMAAPAIMKHLNACLPFPWCDESRCHNLEVVYFEDPPHSAIKQRRFVRNLYWVMRKYGKVQIFLKPKGAFK